MRKRILKITRNFFITVIVLITLAFFAVRTPAVQTWISHRIADYLSNELGTKVTIGSVSIDLWASLHITDVYMEDQKADTLAFIREVTLAHYSFDRHSGKLVLGSLALADPYFNLVRHQGDTLLNYRFLIDYFSSGDTSATQSEIYINQLKLVNGRFNYINENRELKTYYGIDWNHMGIDSIQVDVSNFSMVGDSIHALVNNLSMNEKTGFGIQQLSTDLTLVAGDTRMQNAHLKTKHSSIDGDLQFAFHSVDDFDYFEEVVRMEHSFEKARIHMDELAYFSYELKGFDQYVDLSGRIFGTVSNLKGRKINLTINENTRFIGNFEMEGLPDIDRTFIMLDIDELTSNKYELDQIQLPPYDSLHYLKTPDNFSQLGQISYRGNFTGFINDFVSYGSIRTEIGKIKTDISLKEDPSIDDYRYTGNLVLENFDLGKFYSTSFLGPISSDLSVEGKGLELKKVDASFNGEISQLYLNGYPYSNIVADGTFRHKAFDGNFSIDDPNISMDFTGNIDFTKVNPLLFFDAQIYNLNLKEVNILPNYDYSALSGFISVRSEGFEFEKFVGEAIFDDITYCAQENDYEIKHLELTSTRIGEPVITLESDVAKARITGDFDVSEIGSSLTEIASKIIPSFHAPVRTHRTQNFEMQIEILNLDQVTEVFLPDLHIAPNTRINLQIDEPGSYFETLIVSDGISYGDNFIQNLTLDIRRPDESFYITAAASSIEQGQNIEFRELAIDARTEKDTVYTAIVWGGEDFMHSGDINGKLTVRDYNRYDFTFEKSSVSVYREQWNFKQNSLVSIDSSEVNIPRFEIYHDDQFIRASGRVSHDAYQTLGLEIENFDLANVNPFLGDSTHFYGVVTGNASIRDAYKDLIFANNLNVQDFKINQYLIGDLGLVSTWDQNNRQLRVDGKLDKNLESGNPLTRYTPLSFAGYYRPGDKKSPLDLTATIKDLDLSFINAFMSPGIIDIAGFASGTMAITGFPDAPQMQADALLKDASIFVHYLNTRYFIEERIGVYPDMFTFDHIRIRDQENNKGFLTGQMLHNNFGDWNFDLVIEMIEPMLGLNTTEELNDLYFGRAYATGEVDIYGYEDKLEFDINLKTEKGTTLAMPMGTTSEQTFENFIRFVNPGDTIKQEPLNLSGIKMNFQMEITPDAEFKIIFDESVGDVMKGSGKGNINMEINNLSTFNMYGTVELTRGDYLFTLKNLINKEFVIKPGGTISWFGDPFGGEMDVDAIYKVSASLYDLIPDPSFQNGQRVPINLGMNLTGKIFNPGIEFGIELPTVDQVTRSRVDAAISTEQERNRQAFALLVLRRFVSPPNVTVEHNSTNPLAANGTELLSSQISNWLSQISDDFNLGFNYSPGDDISNEEIALALSTQLFNERLSLSSNVGVSRNTGNATVNQNTTNLIGDVRIEYKITPEGKIRLVVYNESNDFRLGDTQQSPYTQGVGFIYREDFDTIDEFMDGFRKMLRGKKKEGA